SKRDWSSDVCSSDLTYPEDSKESDAEMQKEFFKETYIQNTLGNLAGTDVSEGDVEELADAFLHALSQTKYEVIEKDALDQDNIRSEERRVGNDWRRG